jgi:hypothetical protein|tara:strand:+ start:6686 stop:6913 length:228 start_codon:yes stop_codon:yes gene_type:complete
MDADRLAVKLAIEKMVKDSILGIFGDEPEESCIAKCHTLVEFADSMRIQTIDVKLSLKELRDAKKKYIREVISDD